MSTKGYTAEQRAELSKRLQDDVKKYEQDRINRPQSSRYELGPGAANRKMDFQQQSNDDRGVGDVMEGYYGGPETEEKIIVGEGGVAGEEA